METDTIAAVATAPGRGGIGIIRISGNQAQAIGEAITHTRLKPRHAHYSSFYRDETGLDSGLCLYFPAPNSFTGEDVVELQGHGGPVVLDLILNEVLLLGARQATPGEFSQRAYLNDKMDLAQAEAIADLINSSTEKAALNANRSLQGEFSDKIRELVSTVTRLRVFVEAAIDFPEEEIDFIGEHQVKEQLSDILSQFGEVTKQTHQGALLTEGMKLVIAGKPNAGKSSLLNALSGSDSAIVTAVEGTTRDVLREHIQIDGMPLHIVDTAGLRESVDEIEQEGIRRAGLEMESADRILLVVDGNTDVAIANLSDILPAHILDRNIPISIVQNKCDLRATASSIETNSTVTTIHLSAKTGEGIELLKQHLKESMGYESNVEGNFSARRRHLQALESAEQFLRTGLLQLDEAGAAELLAEDLRQCQQALGEITGAYSTDELLGEIFSSFCIGK